MDDQPTTVDRPEEPPGRPGPADPRSVVWTAVAAVAGLGVVVNAATWTRALPSVFNPVAANGWQGARLALYLAAVVIVGLLTLRWWPWVLLAGAALSLLQVLPMLPLADAVMPLYQSSVVGYLLFAGPPLALLAVLAAAQELLDSPRPGLGAAVAGLTAGAGLFGLTVVGTEWLRNGAGMATWRVLFALLAVAGALTALLRPRVAPSGPPAAGTGGDLPAGVGDRAGGAGRAAGLGMGARATVLGAVAALLVFVPVVLTDQRISDLLNVSQGSLARRPYVVAIIVGLVIVGCAALLAAACGTWAAAGATAAALVQIGALAPMTLVLFAAVAATGGQPEKVATQGRWLPAALLLGLLVAAVTLTVAVESTVAANGGGLPAVFGPIVGALVVGGTQAMTLLQLRGGEPESTSLSARQLGPAAALTVVGIALAQFLRTRLQPTALPPDAAYPAAEPPVSPSG